MNDRDSFQEKLFRKIGNSLSSLFELWEKVGLSDEDVRERMEIVDKQLTEPLTEMVDEETKHADEILKKIQSRERELISLCKELGKSNDMEARDALFSKMTYLQYQNTLNKEVAELRREKEGRMKEVYDEAAINSAICAKMSEPPKSISLKVIPSTEQLEALKLHTRQMEDLYTRRLGKLRDLKLEIINLHTQLGNEPETSFEREVCCGNEDDVILSSNNMDLLERIRTQLAKELEKNIKRYDSLRQKIEFLGQKLEMTDVRGFLEMHKGYDMAVIEELEIKLKELEDLKVQHMEDFIKKIRDELRQWWDKCYYGQAERNQFAPFKSVNVTEAVLNEHETELERIKSYYNENSSLFAMVKEAQDLWATRLYLERMTKDPSRLGDYKRLAQEERDRKRVNNGLPKIEEKLFKAIEQYEEQHKKSFLVGGVPFKEYWAGQNEKHEFELQLERQQKSDFKKQLNIHETIYGSTPGVNKTTLRAGKRPNENDPTPLKNRKIQKIDSTDVQKVLPSGRLQRSGLSIANRKTVRPSSSKNTGSKNDTIITGNNKATHSTIDIDSKLCSDAFHKEAISSTFRSDNETLRRRNNVLSTPNKPFLKSNSMTPFKSSTPMKTPMSSSKTIFKTPNAKPLTPYNKNRTMALRSHKNLPYVI